MTSNASHSRDEKIQLIDYSFLGHIICFNKCPGYLQIITSFNILLNLKKQDIFISFKHKTTSKNKKEKYIRI
jgi:hypothetical protein